MTRDMPHVLVLESSQHPLDDFVELGRFGGRPVLRAHRRADGDAVVLTAAPATRDGLPMLGDLTRIDWGRGAIVRVAALRIDVVWRDGASRIGAGGACACRLCFAAFAPGEPAVSCGCQVAFHEECHALARSCPACGRPAGEMGA